MITISGRQNRAWMVKVLCALLTVATVQLVPASAGAATGDVGFSGPSTAGAGPAPTGQKPESKLWYNDGRWWASMFAANSGSWHVFVLDRSASPESWVDTGTVIDPRPASRSDTLWDGTHLYVASHIGATSNTAVSSGQPARLYRFSYDTATRQYTLDAGYPTTISDVSSETLTIDEDSTGRVWATWAQGQAVYVNATTDATGTWGQPFKLPIASATTLDPDDISTIVAYTGHIGVMWSNHTDSTVYFASHDDTAAVGSWSDPETVTVPGPKQADDHLNIKSIQSDGSGRVFAVIKTSLDEIPNNSSAPQIVVLARRPATHAWDRATFGTVADCHTRPVVMIDSTNNLLHVFATAPDSGCPYSGTAGTIFEKTSPLDTLSLPTGRGTPVMRESASANLNNVSGSKQVVTANTGLVMLASDDVTRSYWFSDEQLTAPVPSFTASGTSGTAPVTVQLTDTSSGSPTSWRWDFGDGTPASPEQNPTHTYSTPGTYTVSLTATNAIGSATVTRAGLVQVAPSPTPLVVAGASSSASSTATTTTVDLPTPAGVGSGDVLVAQFTSDHTPSVTSVPAGWSPVPGMSGPSIGSGARLFAYYHVVADPAAEPPSVQWRLSSAEKWGGGVTAFSGADPTAPFTGAAQVAVDASYTATKLTLPGITTSVDHAVLVGGIGTDSSTLSPTPPAGWTQAWGAGAQYSGLGYAPPAAAGPTGTIVWRLGAARGVAGWMAALQPAH